MYFFLFFFILNFFEKDTKNDANTSRTYFFLVFLFCFVIFDFFQKQGKKLGSNKFYSKFREIKLIYN
jgi:hypothetical protein